MLYYFSHKFFPKGKSLTEELVLETRKKDHKVYLFTHTHKNWIYLEVQIFPKETKKKQINSYSVKEKMCV